MKAVAVHALSIVAIVAIFAFVSVVVFLNWLQGTSVQASGAACTTKLLSYCSEWFTKNFDDGKKPEWKTPDPSECNKFLATSVPPRPENCRDILHIPS